MALLRRVVGMVAGQALARQVGGSFAGPVGAVAGLALPMVARTLGPWGMAAAAVGAWAVSRVARPRGAAPVAPMARPGLVTPPPIPMVMPAD